MTLTYVIGRVRDNFQICITVNNYATLLSFMMYGTRHYNVIWDYIHDRCAHYASRHHRKHNVYTPTDPPNRYVIYP